MINYDDDPRYELLEEGVYLDTQTNETVIVLSDEDAALFRQALALADEQDEYTLTAEDMDKLFGPLLEGKDKEEQPPTD